MPVFLLIKRPFFARLFTKMSPSEQLGTLDSASKRTYGKKQIIAIHKAMDANPRLTASQVKLQLLKVLAGVAPWTVRQGSLFFVIKGETSLAKTPFLR